MQSILRMTLGLALILVSASACSKATLNNKGRAREMASIPSIQAVYPNSGPISGGTPITIVGSNFMPGATVSIDGSACLNVVVVNSSQITCVTPAHPVGSVTVTVVNTSGKEYAMGNAFTYYDLIPPVPGFAIVGGGGLVGNGSVQAITTIGEPVKGEPVQSSQHMIRPGIQGIFFDQ